MAEFPQVRLRRLRRLEQLRKMIAETEINAGDFIYPLFVASGQGIKKEIGSMPGVFQLSTDLLAKEVEEIARLGIPAVLLFGLPETKDELGSGAYSPQGVIQRAIATIKEAVPDLVVVTDVCLCEYTSHGHCGII
ncbi:MAG: porphobilinogen synthase, partial [Dehalococcoidia bacterium]